MARRARPWPGARLLPGAAAVIVLATCGARAQFGPHANAVLIPHLQPGIEYSAGEIYSGQSTLRRCADAIVSGPYDSGEEVEARVFYLILSVENCPGPRGFGGIEFGFEQYDQSAIEITSHGYYCPPRAEILVIPTAGWPGPNEGVAITYGGDQRDRIRTETILELAWFAAYVYGAETLPLGIMPSSRVAQIVDGSNPPNIDELEEWQLGVLAFGQAGYNPCAPPNVRGACCLAGRCQEIYRGDCELQGGVFQGENTDCFPNPCLPPKPTTWGRVKKMYESN